jgi:hypothetical protein
MVVGKGFGLFCLIQSSTSILSRNPCPCQSIHYGGLVPGWHLVLVCWERETVSCCVDNQLVAVWAHSLGDTVTASVATTAAAAATATVAAAATSAAAAPAASTANSFGHSC